MPPAVPPTLRVRVARSFYHQGQPLKVGAEVDLPRPVALEAIATNKATRADAPAPAAAAPKAKPADPKPEGGKDAQ